MITYRGEEFEGYNGSAFGLLRWHNLFPQQAGALFSKKNLIRLHIEGAYPTQTKSMHF